MRIETRLEHAAECFDRNCRDDAFAPPLPMSRSTPEWGMQGAIAAWMSPAAKSLMRAPVSRISRMISS